MMPLVQAALSRRLRSRNRRRVRRLASGRLHYNYYRDLDPQTGRYVESDPVGLGGGINTYNYVRNRPSMATDSTGLVEWKGSVTGGTFVTAGFYLFQLQSKCVNGKQGTATVALAGPGLGLGAEVSASSSAVSLQD